MFKRCSVLDRSRGTITFSRHCWYTVTVLICSFVWGVASRRCESKRSWISHTCTPTPAQQRTLWYVERRKVLSLFLRALENASGHTQTHFIITKAISGRFIGTNLLPIPNHALNLKSDLQTNKRDLSLHCDSLAFPWMSLFLKILWKPDTNDDENVGASTGDFEQINYRINITL